RLLAHSLRTLQCLFSQPLRVRRHLHHGRKIRPRPSPPALFALSSRLRRIPHRSLAGSRRRPDRGDLGGAASAISLARARFTSAHALRALRRRDLSLRLPLSLHIFFLVRGPHRHSSTLLESSGFRPLS